MRVPIHQLGDLLRLSAESDPAFDRQRGQVRAETQQGEGGEVHGVLGAAPVTPVLDCYVVDVLAVAADACEEGVEGVRVLEDQRALVQETYGFLVQLLAYSEQGWYENTGRSVFGLSLLSSAFPSLARLCTHFFATTRNGAPFVLHVGDHGRVLAVREGEFVDEISKLWWQFHEGKWLYFLDIFFPSLFGLLGGAKLGRLLWKC